MSVVPLTKDNLDHLKLAARSAMPQIGSSHLTEALAALLGHGTHAAMLATLAAPSAAPILVRPDPDRFLERLRSMGHAALEGTAVLEALALSVLPTPAWQEFRPCNRDSAYTWFRSCQRRAVPYVIVTTRRKLARLDWDWISVDPMDDRKLDSLGTGHVVDQMFAAFREHAAPRRAVFEGSAFVGHADGLVSESACAIADEIALILNKVQRGMIADAA